MRKNIIAVLAGLVVALVVIALTEWVGHQIYPPPANIDPSNPDDLARLVQQAPVGALLLVVVAHILGALAGGLVAGRLSGSSKPLPAYFIGGLLLVAGLANLLMIPGHPVWFWILDLLVYLPAALAGYRLGEHWFVRQHIAA